MPHKPDYLEPLPGKSVSQPFLDTLKQQARYGGAVDATSNLAAGAKLAQGMGAVGSAFAGLGGQRFGPKLPGTETLEVGPEVGGRGGLTVAQVILSVPEKKLPSWFRALLKSTPESQLPNLMRQSWEKIGEGVTREAFKHKGVVGKIPLFGPNSGSNVREFLASADMKRAGKRGELFRGPEPLAYSTETDVNFSRYFPHRNRVSSHEKSIEDEEILNRFSERYETEKLQDVATFNSGDEEVLHNFGILAKPKGRAFAQMYDYGFPNTTQIPKQISDDAAMKDKLRMLEVLGGERNPKIDKFFEVLKKSR